MLDGLKMLWAVMVSKSKVLIPEHLLSCISNDDDSISAIGEMCFSNKAEKKLINFEKKKNLLHVP